MVEKVLEVKDLVVEFNTDQGKAVAVDGISFDMVKGRTLGLVGESGSGKSVTALSIMRLIPSPPGKVSNGEVLFCGENLLDISMNKIRTIRGNKISMVFQEPMTSLNPVYTCGNQIMEVLAVHQSHLSTYERKNKTLELLELVGIPVPHKRFSEYPHQLSGGMRQRVMIAMSLACEPEILIADEPTTALDATIQAQILEILKKLQVERDMAIMMITHDLGVIAEVCDDVVVMYCGKIVEKSDVKTLFSNPQHPYTKGLLRSMPTFDSTMDEYKEPLITIEGMVPSLYDLPAGCNFQDRCNMVTDKCRGSFGDPELRELEEGHEVSCFNISNEEMDKKDE